MLPEPLHPAIVHFPIVLMFLLPLAVAGALWYRRRDAETRTPWVLTTLLAGALAASAWVAVETGEGDEDRVERVVPEGALECHEEAAERFLALSGGVFLLAGAGLLRGRVGSAARLATGAGALGLVVAGTLVGHSGGSLVYQHGAAAAYAQPGASGAGVATHDSGPGRADAEASHD
jgi:uncharacterized membrane protein